MSRRRKLLIAVGIVLGVAILVPIVHHYQLRAATEAYIAQLKAQGEPMELSQVVPPPVPPEQNSAETFRKAAALIDANDSLSYSNYAYGMEMVAPGKAMIRWQQPDIRDLDATNSWKDVEAAVAQNEKSFALLRQIIAKPVFDFQIKYERGFADFDFTNLYLIESKKAAQRLESAAECDLHRGDVTSAVENLRAMLALAKAIRNERLAISELVRIAMASIAVNANWEILQSTNATDAQLAEMQNDWTSLDFIRCQEGALEMERALSLITANHWRKSPSVLQHYLASWRYVWTPSGVSNRDTTAFDKMKVVIKVFMWRHWWSYPDEIRMLKGCEVLLDTVRAVETNNALLPQISSQKKKLESLRLKEFDDEWEAFFGRDMDMHRMLSSSVISLSGVFRKAMSAEVAKEMTITAIALKRYQLKHGDYPPDLNSLVPELVPKVPLDPVDGQPLRYRRNADGTFLLYSVGENGKDDRGNPALEQGVESSSYYWQNPQALDWVWPQPATAQEIQNYYAHPPK